MATLVIKTNASQATNVTISDVGSLIVSGGGSITLTEADEILLHAESDDLVTLCTDDAHGAGSSTLILNDGTSDIAQADVQAFLATVLLPTSGAFSVPVRDASGNETVSGDGVDTSAIHDDTAGEISAVAEKTTPASADVLLIEDSADSNNKKRLQVGNLPGDSDAIHVNVAGEIAGIAEKATPVVADLLVLEDSADSNNKKRAQIGNLPVTDDQAIHDNVNSEISAITEKTTPIDTDLLLLEDSAASNAKKRVQIGNLPSGSAAKGRSWVFSTTTTDADPGAGTFRLNNAAQASATFAYMDNLASSGVNISSVLLTLRVDDYLYFQESNASGRYRLYRVTGTATDGTGYVKVPITHVSGGSDLRSGKGVTVVFYWNDANAIHSNVAGEIAAIAAKATPVAADTFVIEDSADSNNKKSITMGDIDHDALTNFVVNEHIDWTAASAGTIDPTNYVDNDQNVAVSANDTTPGNLEAKLVTNGVIVQQTLQEAADEQFEVAVHLVREEFDVPAPSATLYETTLTPLSGTDVVYLNGQRLRRGDTADYTLTGRNISMLKTLFADDWIEATYFAEAPYSLMAWMAKSYDWVFLSDHDDTSGSSITDQSGKGNDFPLTDGVVGWQLDTREDLLGRKSTLFKPPDDSRAINSTLGADTSNRINFITVLRGKTFSKANSRFLENNNSQGGGWTIFQISSGNYAVYDGVSYKTMTRTPPTDTDLMIGFSQEADASVDVYENGLFVGTIAIAASYSLDDTATLYNATSGGDNGVVAHIDLTAVSRGYVLTADDHYSIWKKATGQYHYVKEVIEGDMNLGANLILFPPFWEEAGTQAVDVSGNETHGTYVNGPALGLPPLVEGFVKSYAVEGVTEGVSWTDCGIDISTDDCTFAGTIRIDDPDATASNGVFLIGSTNNRFWLNFRDSPDRDFNLQVYDGTTNINIRSASKLANRGQTVSYCGRLRQSDSTISLWIEGVHVGDADFSTATLTSATDCYWPGESGTLNPGVGQHQARGLFNAALTDAQCLALSTSNHITPGVDDLTTALLESHDWYVLADMSETTVTHTTTLVDYSGNGNNGEYYNGTTTDRFEEVTTSPSLFGGRSGVFFDVDTGASHLPVVRWNANYPASGPSYHGVALYEIQTAASARVWTIWTDTGTLRSLRLISGTSLQSYDGTTWQSFARDVPLNQTLLMGWGFDDAAGESSYYENGLFIGSVSYVGSTTNGSRDGYLNGFGTTASQEQVDSTYHLYGHAQGPLTADDHYDFWVKSTGKRHWYRERVVEAGVDGDCVQSLAGWDEAGSQLVDVSGLENHASANSGPQLAQQPFMDRDLTVYSWRATTVGYVDGTSLVDLGPASSAATFVFQVRLNGVSGSTRGLFTSATTGVRTTVRQGANAASAEMRFKVDDGTNSVNVTWDSDTSVTRGYAVALRVDRSTDLLDVWVNGKHVVVGTDISSVTGTTTSSGNYRWGHDDGATIGEARFQHCSQFNVALTDAQCVALTAYED